MRFVDITSPEFRARCERERAEYGYYDNPAYDDDTGPMLTEDLAWWGNEVQFVSLFELSILAYEFAAATHRTRTAIFDVDAAAMNQMLGLLRGEDDYDPEAGGIHNDRHLAGIGETAELARRDYDRWGHLRPGMQRTAPDGPGTNQEGAAGMTAGVGPYEAAGGLSGAEVKTRFEAFDWGGLLGIELPPVEMLPGGLLAAGEQAALIGDGKVGKSLFALEMGYKSARGDGWLGDPARAPMRVVYIDLENSQRQFIGRMQAMGFEPCPNLTYLSFPPLLPVDTPQGGLLMAELIAQFDPELVIIDTVSRLISGRENEADTWIQAYNLTWKQLKARGVAVLRLDHTGKDPERGGRGSSAKTQDIDHVWSMTKVGDEYLLERTHTRTGEGIDRRWVRRDGKHDGQRWVGTKHVPGYGPDGKAGGSQDSEGGKVQEAIIKAIVDNLGTECSLRKTQDNVPTLALALGVDKLTRQQVREAHALMRLRVEKGQPPTMPTTPPEPAA